MSRRGASPFSVAQRPLRAGRATKPARFYDEVRDREEAEEEKTERINLKRRMGVFFRRATFALCSFFFFFFFARAHLRLLVPPISTTHQQEDRLAPVTRVELGKLKVGGLFSEESDELVFNNNKKKQQERD